MHRLPLLLLGGVLTTASMLAADVSTVRIRPDHPLQKVWGLGFEIQLDSIGSGNHGLPEDRIAVPHDLAPEERRRFADEMLKGFRYCRLAGGLYWRGLDPESKFLRPRWPEQLAELRELLKRAGVEGLSFEYWSPAPFWKANASFVPRSAEDTANVLRCFGPDFAGDPFYHGDVDRFLEDFSQAVVTDIKTLTQAGLKVSMWGLQNEPYARVGGFSRCHYPRAEEYVRAYTAVADAVRNFDPSILLFGDTEKSFPRKIALAMRDPRAAALVDAYVVHTVGVDSDDVRKVDARISAELPPRPWFQNEYEYLTGGATPERCLNTVQHIMNSFQLAGNPTWFWIHALKPFKNAEASGYALGFWRSLQEPDAKTADDKRRRWLDGPEFVEVPDSLAQCEMISATRGATDEPGVAYTFIVNQPVTVHLLVEDLGGYTPGAGWEVEPAVTPPIWAGGRDKLYRQTFPMGNISIPAHTGCKGSRHGAPHVAFVEPSDPEAFKAMIGMNVPIQIRSEALALDRTVAGLEPGHWTYNPYNWNAVGSFVKHMPWDSVVVAADETNYDGDARILAFKRPNGKLTIVVSNRTAGERAFKIDTGRRDSSWLGFRYTPFAAGDDTMGVQCGEKPGAILEAALPRLSWEFWEEQ